MRDLIIIGGGPAALAAAIYAGRYERKPLVIAGQAVGGQLLVISEIDNYPGFPEGTSGATLATLMQQQAERFGAEFALDLVTAVDFSQLPFRLQTYSGTEEAQAVIIATGTSRRKLGVPGETEFLGRGVSYCATCDGFFYRGKTVAVVGGGNSAVAEAVVLTRFAQKVYLIHRRDQLRADKVLQDQALANPKIQPVWNSTVEAIEGDQVVHSARLRNVKTGEISNLVLDGIFMYVGSTPNTEFLGGAVAMDEHGYILADALGHTNIPGIYAAGDVVQGTTEQIVVAAGAGANVAITAEQYLAEHEGKAQPPRGY